MLQFQKIDPQPQSRRFVVDEPKNEGQWLNVVECGYEVIKTPTPKIGQQVVSITPILARDVTEADARAAGFEGELIAVHHEKRLVDYCFASLILHFGGPDVWLWRIESETKETDNARNP